jgi:hypothetical protein
MNAEMTEQKIIKVSGKNNKGAYPKASCTVVLKKHYFFTTFFLNRTDF